ncbi:zinc-binding dehydrogenase [Actinomadura sp. WAC 06369]|uniref:zinc-binding dehydrogenase n=1 Tax=Actinomadura sp. WAC 06369 TaxID=2203193 RepID=UPI000F78B73F|nr:zinc-binding dehydrogenase [Actinomadura sp. WAC 06369]RSN62038.1 zinc-binding dehydrogenase [Actinomadura sp. WAC 06369]
MAEMLAGRLDVRTRRFAVKEVPVPEPGHGEVRIAVKAAGVCLSDLHLIDGTLSPLYLGGDEVTLGHEVAGVVESAGEGATRFAPGRRVLLLAGEEDPDGTIRTRGVDYDGGWAQFAVAAERTVVPIPDALPFEQACVIPDAVSTPWAAVGTTARTRPGEAAGVWGLGGLGAHAVLLLRLLGAAPIIAIDPVEPARERALRFGADVALDPGDAGFGDRVRAATGGRGLAVAFDFAGVSAVRDQALGVLGRDGRLVLVGLSGRSVTIAHDTLFSYLRQQVLGHYGSEPEHVEQLVRLVEQGRLDLAESVSDVLPLADAPQAVERLASKEGDPIRLVLRP